MVVEKDVRCKESLELLVICGVHSECQVSCSLRSWEKRETRENFRMVSLSPSGTLLFHFSLLPPFTLRLFSCASSILFYQVGSKQDVSCSFFSYISFLFTFSFYHLLFFITSPPFLVFPPPPSVLHIPLRCTIHSTWFIHSFPHSFILHIHSYLRPHNGPYVRSFVRFLVSSFLHSLSYSFALAL